MSYTPNLFTLKDGPQVSPFGRLRVTGSAVGFDSQQEYGLDLFRLWDVTANGTLPTVLNTSGSVSDGAGNSVGPRDANTGLTPLTVSATNGHYSVLQSSQYVRYVPGFGQLIFITGVFAKASSATAKLVLRTSTSGSASDAVFANQADWSEDQFDGTGKCPHVIDFSKIQILCIDAQMLYAGRVRTYFDIDGMLYPAHYFNVANMQSLPTMQTFNLPVRMEARTSGATLISRVGYFDNGNGVFLETTSSGAGGTVNFECCSVQSEGAEEARGFPNSAGTSATSRTSVTTRRPVLSIRPRTTYNGRTNRGHIEISDFQLTATSNNALYEIVYGGTLTGADWKPVGTPITAGSFVVGQSYFIHTVGTTNFTLIGAASNTQGLQFTATGVGVGTGQAVPACSVTEADTTASAITGGVTLARGRVLSGSGSNPNSTSPRADPRGPLTLRQIDNLAASQPIISLVLTSETGTSNVTADANFHEQVV